MARDFVGASSQYLERNGAPATAVPLSFGLWFKVPNITTNYCLCALVDKDTDSSWFALSARGDLASDPVVFERKDSAPNNRASSTASFSASTWGHALAVASATDSGAVYLSGGSKGTDTAICTPAPDRLSVGRLGRLTPAAYTTGQLAEFGCWTAALSDADAAVLGLGVSPELVRPDALVAYHRLIGRNSPETDERGRFELTVTGATAADHPRILSAPKGRGLAFTPVQVIVTAANRGWFRTPGIPTRWR